MRLSDLTGRLSATRSASSVALAPRGGAAPALPASPSPARPGDRWVGQPAAEAPGAHAVDEAVEPMGSGKLVYTIQPGDTLMKIAQKTLGDGRRWKEIYDANDDELDSPYLIFPGTVLQIPGGDAPVPKKPKPSPSEPRKLDGSGPLLKEGRKGYAVRKLQGQLQKLGFDPGPLDGAFGPKTAAAVRAFQRKEGIAVDAIVGPDTWKHLGIHVKEPQAPAPAGNDSGSKTYNIGGPQPAVRRQGHYIGAGIAARFDAMVAAARRDGVNLQIESGYRSRAEQQALWDRYGHNPARVARPGTSNHEKGNAIDFTNTPGAWAWLKRNATRFGFHNYPPEPWHYSLDGR